MKNETTPSENKTTFNTWGRVAEEQMHRMSEMLEQSSKFGAAALEQGWEFFAYNRKLANDWQEWATKTQRKVAGKIFGTK